jgi:mitogen-activated protein kinase organizer 1
MATSASPPRLLHTWSHAKGPCHIAVFNAGGTYVLSGGQDRLIKLVNADTGTLVNTYSGHGYEVLGIAVTADNSRFASCGGDRRWVPALQDPDQGDSLTTLCDMLRSALYWDVPSSSIIKRFSGHASRINSVAFNAEATVLASGSFDSTVRLWDLRSQQGKPIQVLQDARDSVTSVLINKDRSIPELLVASVDGHVRTYDLRMGEIRSDFFAGA